MMRLDKLLANAGIGSRSEVKRLIKLGLIEVNQTITFDAGLNVDPQRDEVKVDGDPVSYQPFIYLMLNKPKGYVSATEDRTQPTVLSLIVGYEHRDLHLVGRLDKDTTGLILITDDGALTHHLTSPKHEVAKTYVVTLDRPIDTSLVMTFKDGFSIGEGEKVKPSTLMLQSNATDVKLTIYEGKFHQVKRMFAKFGYEVTSLHRAAVGTLTLNDLPVGEYRELTPEEVKQLISL
ncbi:MAG: pseudouridine synthase [Bacilli bacterium]